MEFIVETLARLAANDEKHDIRLARLERFTKLFVRAGRRERRVRMESHQKLTNNMSELANAMTRLAEAQRRTEESIAHTDKRLDAFIDIVRQQQNGRRSQ
ncbi:MAG TPA: hypothetical protein VHQ64_11090 [Pyrinomonadaceae bacterium]|nr:hypothetical protein [Pyrinomonadaceae bacterium]